tara:strand:+ start:792 stop:1058 length:267 start_codon:yes stop_codon:yes gene_type:complete
MKAGDLVKSAVMHFSHTEDISRFMTNSGYIYGTVLEVEDEEQFEKEFRHNRRAGRIFLEARVLWSNGIVTIVGTDTLWIEQPVKSKKW